MGTFLGLAAVVAVYSMEQKVSSKIGSKLCTNALVGDSEWFEQIYEVLRSQTFAICLLENLTSCSPSFT